MSQGFIHIYLGTGSPRIHIACPSFILCSSNCESNLPQCGPILGDNNSGVKDFDSTLPACNVVQELNSRPPKSQVHFCGQPADSRRSPAEIMSCPGRAGMAPETKVRGCAKQPGCGYTPADGRNRGAGKGFIGFRHWMMLEHGEI